MLGFFRRLFGSSPTAEPRREQPSDSAETMAESAAESDGGYQMRDDALGGKVKVNVSATNGSTRYVVLGAGPAGVIASETIRKLDKTGDILLIHGEEGKPYSRMAIPYFLSSMIDEAGTELRKTPGHYRDLGINVQHGWVDGISPDAGRVDLRGGQSVPFDQLLIATGASAIRPPIEGLDLPGVHPCWTLEDARNIVRLAEPGTHVVLLGAGFIGCIILEALVERGVSLSVVEMGDRMVPRMMNEVAGSMLKRWCEGKGVNVLTSTSIGRIEASAGAGGEGLLVDLDNGQQLPAHLVVIAAGVRANLGFLEGCGIKTDQGILVDRFLRSNYPNVYAAGDVAQGPDFSTGGQSVHAVQPTAADHGRIAAINMAGGNAPFKGSLVMNVLDTVGLVSCSFGQWQGVEGGEQAERADADAFKYVNLQFADDHLVGAISLGRTDWVGVIRGLIQTKVPLGPWKQKLMEDPHRIAEAYVARAGA